MESALHLLKQVWGYDAFRGQQGEIVNHVAAGGDAFVLMPTGGGKSLCYQVPGLMREGLTVVISPLIALMDDQVEALQRRGIAAALLNSTLSETDANAVERAALQGQLKFLYLAPERLVVRSTMQMLKQCKIALFAVDEAHCVAQWGHDFRPEYRRLNLLGDVWPDVPRIALTASADLASRDDIVKTLQLENARLFLGSFDRTNIHYEVVPKTDAQQQLLDYLDTHRHECGIVYAVSRRKVEDMAKLLHKYKFDVRVYHAGLSTQERARNQQEFLSGKRMVMCATIAFGMGIDKPDVRWVAHVDLPKSMEGYYQETGRAGRDGQPAQAWLCYGAGDRIRLRKMVAASDASEPRKYVELMKLDALLGYCESVTCRHQTLVGWFDEWHPGRCGMCDNCQHARRPNAHVAALMALSVVARIGTDCTHNVLLDVLTGRRSDDIVALGAEQSALFGFGRRLPRRSWQGVIRQLYGLGYLELDPKQLTALRLSAKARLALRARALIPVHAADHPDSQLERLMDTPLAPSPLAEPSAGKTRRAPYHPVDLSDLEPAAVERFAALKKWRTATAKAADVPPYIVMHDATLKALATNVPHSLDDFGIIPGIGQLKLERYGQQIIDLLAHFAPARH